MDFGDLSNSAWKIWRRTILQYTVFIVLCSKEFSTAEKRGKFRGRKWKSGPPPKKQAAYDPVAEARPIILSAKVAVSFLGSQGATSFFEVATCLAGY
ncbi:MAG: hypothetical protein AB7D37_14500 [Desulfovibrio sp.]